MNYVQKKDPKNKNITVRVTENQYIEFILTAFKEDLSLSGWANQILTKHKNSYGRKENLEELQNGIDFIIEQMESLCQVLDQLKTEYEEFYDRTVLLVLTKIELDDKILKMKRLKKQLAIKAFTNVE